MDMEQWARLRRKVLVDGRSKRSVMSEKGLHWETLQKMLSHSWPPGCRRVRKRGRQIDEQVTKQLDYEPPLYVCRRIVCRCHVRRDEPHRQPVIAELRTMLERSKAGPAHLLAAILTAKYCG